MTRNTLRPYDSSSYVANHFLVLRLQFAPQECSDVTSYANDLLDKKIIMAVSCVVLRPDRRDRRWCLGFYDQLLTRRTSACKHRDKTTRHGPPGMSATATKQVKQEQWRHTMHLVSLRIHFNNSKWCNQNTSLSYAFQYFSVHSVCTSSLQSITYNFSVFSGL